MKCPSYSWFKILISLYALSQTAVIYPISFQNSPQFSIENLKKFMDWYTKAPHPMGTKEQFKIASELMQTLKRMDLNVQELKFEAIIPNYNGKKLGGTIETDKMTDKTTGINIIASKKGKENCSFILGGHYDTKYFKDFRFIGANDGGSSTVLLLELARIMKKSKFPANSYANLCDIHFIFFDGEEAFLNDWNDGKNILGLDDHTYGSTAFVKELQKDSKGNYIYQKKKIELVLILDMIGHKNQQLFITKGSDSNSTQKFLQSAKNLDIFLAGFPIEDDHSAFAEKNIPFIHIIDWKNLNEWHTVNDTKEIISFAAIKKLAEAIKLFLSSERLQNNG